MNTVQEYRTPLLIGAITIVVAILLYAFLISPQDAKLTTLATQKSTLQGQASQLQTQLTVLQTEKQKLPGRCADLQKISTQIPSVQTGTDIDAEESSFESQLDALIAQSGVTITAFSGFTSAAAPSPAGAGAAGTGVVPVPTTMTVTGTFNQMSNFIRGLDNFPRLFVIQKFTLSIGTTGAASTTPLWIGGQPTAPTGGPYSLAIGGSIYYTSTPNGLAACAKATAK
jgi:Tfp pilus assembly protein PilO